MSNAPALTRKYLYSHEKELQGQTVLLILLEHQREEEDSCIRQAPSLLNPLKNTSWKRESDNINSQLEKFKNLYT